MKTKMITILESGGKLSTADVNRLKFLRQELVPVYILSGMNYSIINDTRGAAACFNPYPHWEVIREPCVIWRS